ncbi:MAG: hypothetical protein Q9167_003947 [Letrouitia subvulpina]
MRVVTIGILREQDLTDRVWQEKSYPEYAASMTSEYAWSQIEPAIAIICGCVVTYKPLFTNLHILRVQKLFSSHRQTSSSEFGHWTDMPNGRRSKLSWPVARDFNPTPYSRPPAVFQRPKEGLPRRPEFVIQFEGPDDSYLEIIAQHKRMVKVRREH